MISVTIDSADLVVAGSDTMQRRVTITVRAGRRAIHISGDGPTEEDALAAAASRIEWSDA